MDDKLKEIESLYQPIIYGLDEGGTVEVLLGRRIDVDGKGQQGIVYGK